MKHQRFRTFVSDDRDLACLKTLVKVFGDTSEMQVVNIRCILRILDVRNAQIFRSRLRGSCSAAARQTINHLFINFTANENETSANVKYTFTVYFTKFRRQKCQFFRSRLGHSRWFCCFTLNFTLTAYRLRAMSTGIIYDCRRRS